MKTCVMECYTHRWNKTDIVFKYHQMWQIGFKKKTLSTNRWALSSFKLATRVNAPLLPQISFFTKINNPSSSRTLDIKKFQIRVGGG